MIKVIAFDVFNTVFSLSGADPEDIKAYGRHIRQEPWSPLKLPASWEFLKAHPDSVEGIRMLRRDYIVVTCSNGPLGLLAKMSKNAGVHWDAIIPLEMNKVFKPNHKAYLTVCEVMDIRPEEMMMVTANESFGDLEASHDLGMIPMLIRTPGRPSTIVELAEDLAWPQLWRKNDAIVDNM